MTVPRPMLASTGDAPLQDPALAYEPKYDGVRTIAVLDGDRVQLWSRLGNEKTAQFPEIASALKILSAQAGRPLIVDGEIVALDANGSPAGFQNLQGRIHLQQVGRHHPPVETAFIAFDLLRDGDEDLCRQPLRVRRVRLEQAFGGASTTRLRISEQAIGDGRPLRLRAEQQQWEGLVAKRLDSPYRAGKRSPDWRKLKLVRNQTCVVGGWTDPRGSRPFFGALLLGVYDEAGRLRYVGHSGAGFSDAELGRVWKRLQAIQTRTCPFADVPRTNERPHWVKPILVAAVKFTEWTADARLRHPTYLGLRDDVKATSVRKEPDIVANPIRAAAAVSVSRKTGPRARSARRTDDAGDEETPRTARSATSEEQQRILQQLDAIEADSGRGVLDLPKARLEVTNLGKVFWPALTKKERPLTKGDLFRHYVRVAPVILPALADRPLVMKRFPNGVSGKPFYQHRAADALPPGVRVERVTTENETRPHIIGGDLVTLLYTAQLASISQDPWFSRVGSESLIDHIAIDLDPPDELPFARVLDVARWVRDELASLGIPAFAKTSGSGGLHIYVPMPARTPYDAGLLFCQVVATRVATKHPKLATVERSIRARGQRIYIDYLQNIQGKTLASAYSVRANTFAGVSTPITWEEVDDSLEPRDFTLTNFAKRLAAVGDLWAALRKAKGANLRAVT